MKAEYLQRVDVREWARRGYLERAHCFSWGWRRGDEPTGSISVYVQAPDAVTLNYSVTIDGISRAVCERVGIVRTICAYGGSRPWFTCTRCPRRVAVLYLRRGCFACRHCQRVAYSTQSEDALGRMWRKQAKIEARLDENWQRPTGMRQRTYKRLTASLWELEVSREEALELFAGRLMGLC